MILGIIGLINAGKSTVANILVEDYGFIKVSFADSLIDAVASIFGWDRQLLQGDTEESRLWREQVDSYWSNVMQHPVTPRWVLQHIGTDVMRDHFYESIWVHSLMRKLTDSNNNYVISDVRFLNEIDVIISQKGKIWEVQRPPLPDWYMLATSFKDDHRGLTHFMSSYFKEIHSSEWDWNLAHRDQIIQNDGSLDDLKNKIKSLV